MRTLKSFAPADRNWSPMWRVLLPSMPPRYFWQDRTPHDLSPISTKTSLPPVTLDKLCAFGRGCIKEERGQSCTWMAYKTVLTTYRWKHKMVYFSLQRTFQRLAAWPVLSLQAAHGWISGNPIPIWGLSRRLAPFSKSQLAAAYCRYTRARRLPQHQARPQHLARSIASSPRASNPLVERISADVLR